MKAKKIWGQHFLEDAQVVEAILNHLPEIDDDSIVIEVGPGKGVLTQHLISIFQNKFYAVEIDPEMFQHISLKFPNMAAHFFNQNFLDFNFDILPAQKIFVIGNFPYNISTQIIFKCLENKNRVSHILGMFQKEVGKRIVSPHGSKVYGVISVLCNAYYDGSYLFDVSNTAFKPPPDITSGVIYLKRNQEKKLDCDEEKFTRLVKAAFNQRRKMLRNSLKSYYEESTLSHNKIFTLRPEQLSLKDFVYLTNL